MNNGAPHYANPIQGKERLVWIVEMEDRTRRVFRHKRPWGLDGVACVRWDDSIHGLYVLIGVEGSTMLEEDARIHEAFKSPPEGFCVGG